MDPSGERSVRTVYILDADIRARAYMAGVVGDVYGIVALSHGDELVAAYSDVGPSCLVADFATIGEQISSLRARLVELAIELPMVCVMLHADVRAAVAAM